MIIILEASYYDNGRKGFMKSPSPFVKKRRRKWEQLPVSLNPC